MPDVLSYYCNLMIKNFVSIVLLLFVTVYSQAQKQVTDYVNPFLGTATLWDSIDIGYKPTHRTWGAEAFHKYTFSDGQSKKLLADLSSSNERVRSWSITQQGENVFTGFQQTGEKMYFYAVTNHKIKNIDSLKTDKKKVSVVNFVDESKPLEIQIGFSFVSIKNAKENLEKEMLGKSFAQVRKEATGK